MKKYFLVIAFLGLLLKLSAQSNIPVLTQRYDAYQKIWPKTKIQLVFSQEKFSPGDTIYFKAYFFKEDMSYVPGMQLINFNLVDSKGASKLHFLLNTDNGVGQNQFAVPQDISAGIYLVTAYSDWMKNFDTELIFKKEVVVVKKNTVERSSALWIKGAPEGGHLISGISNRIGIWSNRGSSSVSVFDKSGAELGSAVTDMKGLSSITFTPQKSGSYFLRFVGDTARFALPKVEDDGLGIALTMSDKVNPVQIAVTSPATSTIRKEPIAVVVTSRGKVRYAESIQITKDVTAIQILQSDLPEGVAHVSFVGNNGNLLASRDFYSSGKGEAQAKITLIGNDFKPRGKIRMEIALTDESGSPVAGEFSIGVLNASLFTGEHRDHLTDELNILAGAKGTYVVDRSNPNWLMSLDNYLITVTQEVAWKEILAREIKRPSYPFSNLIEKTGRAYYADTTGSIPVPDLTQLMFYLQRDKLRHQTFAMDKGKFSLTIPILFGNDEFFYMGELRGNAIPKIRIEWDNESIRFPAAAASRETTTPDFYAAFVSKSRVIGRSYGFYSSPQALNGGDDAMNSANFEKEVGGADVTINIQDYNTFSTMEELVKEIIPSLSHRKRGGKSIIRASLIEPMKPSSADPVYIIDGIANRNTDFFLALNPADVINIKIVKDPKKLVRFKLMGKNGIVMVQTKKGNVREPLDDPSKLIEGSNQVINFTSHDYSISNDARKPDFRSTVYWNPSVKTDSNGKAIVEFFSTDDVGKMLIRVNGLTDGVKAFSAQQDVEIGVN
ncbi:MAG: hypothetical protein HOP08_13875 [Cyclobacteriaceae bacterium]|nr:hypothetical protein [Cyclobacteriaceae bacterium]